MIWGAQYNFGDTSFIYRSNHKSDLKKNKKIKNIFRTYFFLEQMFLGAFKKLLTFLTDGSGYFENTTNNANVDGHSARPHGGILKIPHVQPSVCVCSGGSCRETQVSPKNRRCPHILLKNSASWSKTAVLTVICGGIGGF